MNEDEIKQLSEALSHARENELEAEFVWSYGWAIAAEGTTVEEAIQLAFREWDL